MKTYQRPSLSLIQWLNISFYFILLVFFLVMVQKLPVSGVHGMKHITQEIRRYFTHGMETGNEPPAGLLIQLDEQPLYWRGWHSIERFATNEQWTGALSSAGAQQGMLWLKRRALWDEAAEDWTSKAKEFMEQAAKHLGYFSLYWWIVVDETAIVTDDDRKLWQRLSSDWSDRNGHVGWMTLPASMQLIAEKNSWIILEIREEKINKTKDRD
jgi:hypothetical protein